MEKLKNRLKRGELIEFENEFSIVTLGFKKKKFIIMFDGAIVQSSKSFDTTKNKLNEMIILFELKPSFGFNQYEKQTN